jgi:hypothetical protein
VGASGADRRTISVRATMPARSPGLNRSCVSALMRNSRADFAAGVR